jgi:hypothetical protein
MPKNLDHPNWFLYWSYGDHPYVTRICGWSRKEMISAAEQSQHQTWKQIYARGGRAVRMKMTIAGKRNAKTNKSAA